MQQPRERSHPCAGNCYDVHVHARLVADATASASLANEHPLRTGFPIHAILTLIIVRVPRRHQERSLAWLLNSRHSPMLTLALRHRILNAFAACFGVVSAYHAAASVWRSLDPTSSPLRHALFVFVDLAVGVGLWWRPRGFFWVFAALAVQQLHSHGLALLQAWNRQHRIDWMSVLVLMSILLVCYLLYEKPAQS
jgi:hypothetical protein